MHGLNSNGHESRHQCLIYDGPPSIQLPSMASMMRRKLGDGYRCVYLNSRPMVAGMRMYLAAAGVDVAAEVARASLVLSSDPVPTDKGEFDIERMIRRLGEAVDEAAAEGYKGLWVAGDVTWEFGAKKNFAKLLEYEWRLEELSRNPK